MKFLLVFLFSVIQLKAHAASCCVANTSVPNLMLLPTRWQQTTTVSNSRVIGDVNAQGRSTFRRSKNREELTQLRVDLAYAWHPKYQNGFSVNYQNRNRAYYGSEAADSGWSDLGFFQAWQPIRFQRTYLFNSINIPTTRSLYDSQEEFAVDVHGTGTYQASLGVLHVENFKTWDAMFSAETHHSFARSFRSQDHDLRVGSFWGGSLSAGLGYIPWRSKMRYGLNLTPRLEGQKEINSERSQAISKQSLVWDTGLNLTYTFNASYAAGFNYLDQTVMGPARNTLLNRAVSLLFQAHFL